MARYRSHVAALLTTGAGLLLAGPAQAAWQNGAPFGASLSGDLYSPSTPAASPAVLVAIHYCTGHASSAHGWFDSYAEQHGFYIIAPDAGKQCFDSSITRGGDRAAIVTMVDYVIAQKGADPNRVFAAGLSSGGCMTNTLLAIYPDVFAGGAAMPGFPAGAWPAGDTTCTKCGSSPASTDGAYWGDMARSAFSWDGPRPCVQQWVGGGDEYNFNGYLPAVAAQFQNLGSLGSGTPGTGAPSGWTRTEYKDTDGNVMLQTNLGPASQRHDLSGSNLWGQVVSFLGLDQPTGACGITTTTGTGGAPPTGGAPSTGGVPTGGVPPTGGFGGSGTGGLPTTGGVPTTGGSTTGGLPATGGVVTGGLPATGGVATGGLSATGGAMTGGFPTVGGTATGGFQTTGGVNPAAGGTGGYPAGGTGGYLMGGTSSGGDPAMSTGGDDLGNTTDSDEDGGCACRAAGENRSSGLWALGLLGVAVATRRRWQRKWRGSCAAPEMLAQT